MSDCGTVMVAAMLTMSTFCSHQDCRNRVVVEACLGLCLHGARDSLYDNDTHKLDFEAYSLSNNLDASSRCSMCAYSTSEAGEAKQLVYSYPFTHIGVISKQALRF